MNFQRITWEYNKNKALNSRSYIKFQVLKENFQISKKKTKVQVSTNLNAVFRH